MTVLVVSASGATNRLLVKQLFDRHDGDPSGAADSNLGCDTDNADGLCGRFLYLVALYTVERVAEDGNT